jgi:hypothetical protein
LILNTLSEILQNKLLDIKCTEALLKNNLISNSIMYKTWNSIYNRKEVLDIIQSLKIYRKIFAEFKENKIIPLSIREEIKLLESLCEHECIREDIKLKLAEFFSLD